MISLNRGAVLSLACGFLFLILVEAIGVAWATQYSALNSGSRISAPWRKRITQVASFPTAIRGAFGRASEDLSSDPDPLLVDVSDRKAPRYAAVRPDSTEHGYLLLSGVSKSARQSVVRLIRLRDDATLWEWRPDFHRINQWRSNSRYAAEDTRQRGRAVAPLLESDGSIIFNSSGNRMVRLDVCSRLRWVLPGPFHHSIERDVDGTLWAPATIEHPFPTNEWMDTHLRDDAIAHVTPDGRLLSVVSVSSILISNGLQGLLLGQTYDAGQYDPIHLNEIQPATTDGAFWRRGDLLLSAAHLSTVFLYRPSTGRILWHKTGPWLAQHDPEFVDGHRISVFGNDVVLAADPKHAFLTHSSTNQVYIYDFANDALTTPFAPMLAITRPRSVTEGRAKVLQDGSVFIEDTEGGRQLRVTPDRVLWSRVNWYDSTRVGNVAWSRYMTERDVLQFQQLIALTKCVQSHDH